MQRVFPKFRTATLDDYNPETERQQEVKTELLSYLGHLKEARDSGLGILLLGATGVGKTMLACAVLNAVFDAGYRIECLAVNTYVHLHHERGALESRIRVGDESAVERLQIVDFQIRRCLGTVDRRDQEEWLLVDGLGEEYESEKGWGQALLGELIQYRCFRCLPTVVTSEVSLQELSDRYGARLVTTMYSSMMIKVLDGDNGFREPTLPWNTVS